jgi:hypothetical protein
MNLCCGVAFALAQRSGVDEMASRMAEGFRGDRTRFDPGTVLTLILATAAIVLALWLVSYCSAGRRRPAAHNSPGKLFLALCRAHRLGWRDAWLLWRLARWHELEAPARLFLEPDRFDFQGLNRSLTRRAARLQSLRRRLFADLPEADGRSAPPTNSGAFGLPLAGPTADPGTVGTPPPISAIA